MDLSKIDKSKFEAKCPICNGMLTELKDYGVGFGKLICPKCGYKKIK